LKRRLLIHIVLALIIIGLSFGIQPVQATPNSDYIIPKVPQPEPISTSQTRYPTGDNSSTGTWAVFPTNPITKWDKVDDDTDSDTSYLTHGTSAGYALFNFSTFDIPSNSTISNLQITYTARDVTNGANNLRAAIRVGGTNYLTNDAGIDPSTGYISYTYTFATNPKTVASWTVDDILGKSVNSLQAFGTNSSDANPAFRITSVKATVNYTYTPIIVADPPVMPAYVPMDDGDISLAELTVEVQADTQYSGYTFNDWDLLIRQKGISHIDDSLLADFVSKCPTELTTAYNLLSDLYTQYPSSSQVTSINTNLIKLQTQRATAQATLDSVKGSKVSDPDILKAMIQDSASKVVAIDSKIDTIYKPLQIPDQIAEQWRFIASKKSDFACALKEQSFRSLGQVTRTYIHSIYYLDFTSNSGTITAGATGITFTNGAGFASASATFTTAGNTKVVVGDYIRVSNGTQWYKVATIAATSGTLTPVFQQGTVTDTANATLISCPATHDGRTAHDGALTTTAFCHLNQYTTDAVRTAGDILKVRANQTHIVAGINITTDEAGTVTSYDEIRGCSVADDPFADASNTQPIFNFGNTAFDITCSKNYWRFYNLDLTNSSSNTGIFYDSGGYNTLDTCTIHLSNHATTAYGIYNGAGTFITVINCTLYSNKHRSIYTSSGQAKITSCTLNGGAGTTDYGIYGNTAIMEVSDTTVSVTTAHDTAISVASNIDTVTSEDNGQSIGEQKTNYSSGSITKSSTILRTGGGASSALMLPSSVVTIKYPANLTYGSLNPDFAVWCPASATTVTVYMRSNGQWNAYPTIPTNPDDNLILYPSIEATTGWTLVGAGATFTSDATQKKYGAKAGKLVRSGTDCYIYYPLTNYPNWSGNITYTAWVYATAGNRARIAINDGTTTTYSSYHTGGSTFEQLSVTASVTAGTMAVQFRNYVDTGDTTAYFDGAYCAAPINTQLTITADYWAGAGAIRTTSAASTQHLWDNNEPARLNDGTQPTLTADATTDTTHVIDAGLASAVDDNYNGWYLYNVTRSAGAEVTDYTGASHTILLGSAIASQASGDTYYLMNWVAFTTTFTPGTAGFAYIKVNLGLYIASRGIYVDIKPVASY
jgi:hypothetical protein